MDTINKIIDKIMKGFLALSTAILFAVTVVQVVSRFIFRNPIPWSTDIVRLAFIYLVFLGAAYCVKSDDHLRIDVLLTYLKPKNRAKLEILINFVLLIFLGFLAYTGMKFTTSGMNQRPPSINMPMAVYYFAVPLSAFFMIYYLVQQFINQIKVLKKEGN